MAILADTNVLIYSARLGQILPADSFISIITVGEMKAFALRNNWGYRKMMVLNGLLKATPILDLDANITDTYAIVDTFSQGLLTNDPLPAGLSARNRGRTIFGLRLLPCISD
ncbi:MAG: hypothetical protein H7Z75_09600 [Ferruginibacter sp.]|nr:hypothetical protein [Cytophagales bacterium]